MFLILVLLLNIQFTDSLNIISRGKTLRYCRLEISVLTDGNRETAVPIQCEVIFIVDVGHFVKHVLIFAGLRGSVSTPLHGIDLLQVNCADDEYKFPCAAPSGRINKIKRLENGVRFNIFKEVIKSIFLVFPENSEVTIAEIEIYARGPGDIIHRGCFTKVSGKSFTFAGLKDCQKNCKQSSFGISKPLSSCLCLDEIDFANEVTLSKCQSTCDDYRCGGTNSHSIYIQEYYVPTFIGCRNKGLFDLVAGDTKVEVFLRDLTFSKCVRYCGSISHTFSYVLNSTCGCYTPTFEIPPLHEVYCDVPCKFDNEMTCGGGGGISVYRNCKTNKYVPCDKLLTCKKAAFNHHGVCNHGCKSGFEGEHCMLKAFDPISGDLEEPDEKIEILDPAEITEPDTTNMLDTTTTQNTMKSPSTTESSSDITVRSKSVRVMADFSFSIWVAVAAFY